MKVDVHSVGLAVLSVAFLYQHWLISDLQLANDKIMSLLNNGSGGHQSQSNTEPVEPYTESLRKNPVTLSFPKPIAPTFVQKERDNNRDAGGGGNDRKAIYGGAGDEVHLGGFTVQDNNTISYNTWNYMLGPMAVKSFIDIGCGRGFSSKYFKDNGETFYSSCSHFIPITQSVYLSFILSIGARVTCVEGSHDAIRHSLLPRDSIIQHDFSKGVW